MAGADLDISSLSLLQEYISSLVEAQEEPAQDREGAAMGLLAHKGDEDAE